MNLNINTSLVPTNGNQAPNSSTVPNYVVNNSPVSAYNQANKISKSNFSQLPLYKSALDLERQLAQSTQKTRRSLKYTEVARVQDEVIKLITDIAFASEFLENRKQLIEKSLRTIKEIKIRLRILLDLGAITKNGYSAITIHEEDIDRQLKGWLKSLTKPSAQQPINGATCSNSNNP